MAINRPVTASTQIGIVTGMNEGYANQTDFVEALKPLIVDSISTNFTTKQQFIDKLPELSHIEDGQTVFAGGYPYVKLSTSTSIPDIPGWTNPQYGELLAAPVIAPVAIHPSVSGSSADAPQNALSIQSAIFESAATGRTVKLPPGTIPIRKHNAANNYIILLPSSGEYRIESEAKLLIQDNAINCLQHLGAATLTNRMNNVIIDGWVQEWDIDPVTGNPYIGRGLFGRFSKSEIYNFQNLNHWGASQATWLSGYETTFYDPVTWSENDFSGPGGFRIVGGDGFIIKNAKIISGDDAAQIVPATSGAAFAGEVCRNIRFQGGYSKSHEGHSAYILQNETATSQIEGCGISDMVLVAGPRSTAISPNISPIAISVKNETAPSLSQCFIRSCTLDESERTGATGVCASVAMFGPSNDCDITDIKIIGPQRELINVGIDPLGGTMGPQRCRISVEASEVSATPNTVLARIGAGDDNTVSLSGVCNGTHGVTIQSGRNNTLRESRIRGVAAGQSGIQVAPAATEVNLISNTLTGNGNSIVWTGGAAGSSHLVAMNRLGGMPTVNLGAAVQVANI